MPAARAPDDRRGDPPPSASLPLDRLRPAAELLLRHRFECWFYGDSIGFEGLLAAAELLADPRYAAFAHGFLRAWAARREPYRADDNTAPGHVLCRVVEENGDEPLLEAAVALAEHLACRRRIGGVSVTFEDARRSLRRPYGNVRLPAEEEALLADPGAGVYVDSLHFDPPFFAHLGRLTGDRRWVERAIEEALGYGKLLLDTDTGLYHHFFLERTGRAYGPGWGRGQGWALLGLLDVVELTAPGEPGREELVRRASALAGAMARRQRPDGSWPTAAHLPDSGEESSTAAFMAIAFRRAVRLGVVPRDPFADAASGAWDATSRQIGSDGILRGVSAAVYSSTAPGHYLHVPIGFVVPWGQGPLLVAALEEQRARTVGAEEARWTEGAARAPGG